MQITSGNVGDIIRMDANQKLVQIKEVKEDYIIYQEEYGSTYATAEREIAGAILEDSTRRDAFFSNARLGRALYHSELSAIQKLMDKTLPEKEREDAMQVLGSVKQMQEHLKKRIHQLQAPAQSYSRSSLADLISKASSKSSQSQAGHTHSAHDFPRNDTGRS